jgi:hypothetical protein
MICKIGTVVMTRRVKCFSFVVELFPLYVNSWVNLFEDSSCDVWFVGDGMVLKLI